MDQVVFQVLSPSCGQNCQYWCELGIDFDEEEPSLLGLLYGTSRFHARGLFNSNGSSIVPCCFEAYPAESSQPYSKKI